ncbi:mammalian cell entry protein [Mycobacterium sp. GA-1999]|nr:mammalian cell entry protein [Mycobacterium sp. GA-0227b]KUH84519.1 mammalian cell entry protein [Mycobacterium sp. GA-1999]KUH89424.1 mammalian cell entry protein [Mycobacterium sp. IS-1556]
MAMALVLVLIGGVVAAVRAASGANQTNLVAYFENSNGIFEGDNVVILGVAVGKIEKIEPQPERVKISFWIDEKYRVPVDAKAVILSPSLVTVRAIELTPAYTGGPVLREGAVIPRKRTAVPVEFDDLRQQLEKLADTLQPTQPGGVSTLGAFVNTAANNLRGQGADIRDTVIKLSQAINALGDHSDDLFGTFQNLATLVSALQDSTGLLKDLNQNLAAVTGLLANDPNEVENAVRTLNDVADDVTAFVADNRETLGTTSDKLASVSTAVAEIREDLKQTLHIAPTALQNLTNIYEPAHLSLTGNLSLNNFANPIQFLCGAVQAASRLGAEQSAKLCVQYLAPIVKNRQYNFLPFGLNPFVGAQARPNEITYAEDWLRPDYIPPPASPGGAPIGGPATGAPPPEGPLPPPNQIYTRFGEPADPYHGQPPFVPAKPPNPIPTNPADGLPGMMAPPGGGR